MSYTRSNHSPISQCPLVLAYPARILLHIARGLAVIAALAAASMASSASPKSFASVNFGPNVYIFTPSMPLSQIQATVDSIATQQVPNQFGTQRYALLFEPGTYGTATNPLNFQIGYY